MIDITRLQGFTHLYKSAGIFENLVSLTRSLDLWIEDNFHCPETVFINSEFMRAIATEAKSFDFNTKAISKIETLLGTLKVQVDDSLIGQEVRIV